VMAVVLLGMLALPLNAPSAEAASAGAAPMSQVFWEDRGLDVLVQIILIFSGVLGLIGLLAEVNAPFGEAAAAEITAKRNQELLELQQKTLR
jgi:hypothetical protein